MNVNYKMISQIVLNVTLVSSVIGLLFFTYAKNVEEKVIEEQSRYVSETLAEGTKMFFPSEMRKDICEKISVPDMRSADEAAKKNNIALEKLAASVLGSIFAAGILITVGLCSFGNVSKKHVFIEGAVILCFVIATEIMFLNVVGRNHKFADPNFVKCEIVKSIKNEFPPMEYQPVYMEDAAMSMAPILGGGIV